jgi:glyoxylase-like metal-dependent hydrolase (beta-lactamase superfamily II)
MAQISEIVDGIYRICIPPTRDVPISFNQFLIDDERPTLIHTGFYESYDAVRAAVAEVLDPKRLAYVVLGHFEADECGGMDRFHADAPASVLVASELGADVNLAHWGYRVLATTLTGLLLLSFGDETYRHFDRRVLRAAQDLTSGPLV